MSKDAAAAAAAETAAQGPTPELFESTAAGKETPASVAVEDQAIIVPNTQVPTEVAENKGKKKPPHAVATKKKKKASLFDTQGWEEQEEEEEEDDDLVVVAETQASQQGISKQLREAHAWRNKRRGKLEEADSGSVEDESLHTLSCDELTPSHGVDEDYGSYDDYGYSQYESTDREDSDFILHASDNERAKSSRTRRQTDHYQPGAVDIEDELLEARRHQPNTEKGSRRRRNTTAAAAAAAPHRSRDKSAKRPVRRSQIVSLRPKQKKNTLVKKLDLLEDTQAEMEQLQQRMVTLQKNLASMQRSIAEEVSAEAAPRKRKRSSKGTHKAKRSRRR